MHSAFLALFWHQWIRTRKMLLGMVGYSLGVLGLSLLGHWLRVGDASFQAVLPQVHLGFQTIIIVAVTCLVATLSDEVEGRFGVGRYLLTLPVRSKLLALAFMAYTALVTGVMLVIVMVFQVLFFGWQFQSDNLVTLPYWLMPLVPLGCVMAALVLQGGLLFSEVKNEVLVGAALLLALALAVADVGAPLLLLVLGQYSLVTVLIWGASLAIAWGLSYAGVSHARCERSRSIRELVLEMLNRGQGRTRPFRSPAHALDWYGWRRYSVPFLVITIPLTAASMALAPTARLSGGWTAAEVGQLLLALPFGAVVLGEILVGAIALQTHEYMVTIRGGNSFLFVLPVRSSRLARGSLYPQARAIAAVCLSIAPMLLLGLRWWLSAGQWHALFPLAAAAIVLGAALTAWIALWLVIPLTYGCVLCAIVGFVSTWLIGSEQHTEDITAGLITALLLLSTLATVGMAGRGGHLNGNTLLTMFAAWVFSLVVGALILAAVEPGVRSLFVRHPMLAFSATLLGPLPLAVAPLAIDWFRHGGGRRLVM